MQHAVQTVAPNPLHRLILLVLAGLFFAHCLWRAGTAPIIDGLPFKDSDDIMRLLQVQQWLDSGAWHDLMQPRLNPPDGVAMHWSRLPDLPLAAMIALSEPLIGGERTALLAALLVPALLGVAFFAAFVWAARPVTGRKGQVYAGLIGVVSSVPQAAFAAGRIDHHGWQLLLATLGAGAVLRMLAITAATATARPILDSARPQLIESLERSNQPELARLARLAILAAVAGLAGALGLWVGAEAIPALAFATGALTVGWLLHGRAGALALALFGLALLLASLIILPVALGPGARAATFCDAFSWVSVGLAAAVALFGLGAVVAEARLADASPRKRLVAALFIALPLLGLLYALFPHCAAGPYAGLSPMVAQMITRISEAQPLTTVLSTRPGTAAQYAALPLLALALGLTRLYRLRGHRAAPLFGVWLGLTLLVGGGLLLQGWQLRGAGLANVYAGLVCAGWAASVGRRIRPGQPLPLRLLRRAGPALVVGLLPLLAPIAVQQLTDPRNDVTEEVETADKTDEDASCDLHALAARLNQSDLSDRAPLLIAAPINLGAPLLWLTPHQVLAAPYHRNDSGIAAGIQVFFRDAETARAVVAQRSVDLLVICPHDPVATHERGDGVSLFYDQLRAGETPDWLVEISQAGAARLLAPVIPR
jgi:hypothetical protein